jgi:hypothetical protein
LIFVFIRRGAEIFEELHAKRVEDSGAAAKPAVEVREVKGNILRMARGGWLSEVFRSLPCAWIGLHLFKTLLIRTGSDIPKSGRR